MAGRGTRCQSTAPSAGDEEAARAVHVRQREQELGPARMPELRPFVAERQDAQAARLDDRLVLVRVHGTDGVDDRAARADALRGRAQQRELELRQRARAPAQVGPLREHAGPRARRVDERPVEAGELGRQLGAVRLDDRHVVAAERVQVLAQLARAVRVELDRGHLAAELPGLAARRGAEVEHALAVTRADGETCELGAAALRPDPPVRDRELVHALDAVRAGHVGRLGAGAAARRRRAGRPSRAARSSRAAARARRSARGRGRASPRSSPGTTPSARRPGARRAAAASPRRGGA